MKSDNQITVRCTANQNLEAIRVFVVVFKA